MKIFFDALGCPKALVDAEKMCYLLERDLHVIVSIPEEADEIVINTCGFIDKAKEENIEAILNYAKLKKNKPGLKIVVSGCLTERYKKDLLDAIPEIDGAVGVRDQSKLIDALKWSGRKGSLADEGPYKNEAIGGRKLYFSGLFYSYLKISEGCSRSCSFCAVPGIRGIGQSRTVEEIVKEASELADAGIRELIIISEDTMSYGIDLYRKFSLNDLLEELLKIGFSWIRLMYLYPDKEVQKVAQYIASDRRLCKYLDMPFQHVSRSILTRMKRAGGYDEYLLLLKRIREICPEIRIRSSFISGYPGETENDHEELKSFLREATLDRVGFFEYSDEESTPAFFEKHKLGSTEKKMRVNDLAAVQEDISIKRLSALAGREIICINDGQVINEGGKEYLLLRSEYDAPDIDGYVRVEIDDPGLMEKDFIRVLVKGPFSEHDLEAVVLPS